MESKKWYGLTIPKKTVKVNTKGKSIFDSDDSDENAGDRVKIKKGPTSPSKEKKKKKIPDSKQEEVDSNIYEYDSIYDEMKSSQKQKSSNIKSKEPRYINLLLKAAEKRKKESERRVERKIQAERVKEGDEFKDKEAFVTSAYRQKMIEMEEEEEHERREAALEETMDSTKQKDLSGFYRHFLKQTVGEEKIPEFGERDAKISGTSKIKQEYMGSNKSRQGSESPSDVKDTRKHSNLDYEDDHSDKTKEPEKSHRSDSLHKSVTKDSKQSAQVGSDKSGHSKDKTSSHRNKTRHHSDLSSDSEERKGKHSLEKSHKKSGHSTHSSKHERDGKSKYSHSSRTHEEKKMYDQYKYDHSKGAAQKASPEKHSDGHSPSKSHHPQRSKLDKDREENKKEKTTHSETEKGSLQTNLQSISANHNRRKDKRSSSNENKVDYLKSKGDSYDDRDSSDEKYSSSTSKKRENRKDHYSETKRRKFNYDDNDDNDDDDDDQSTSSSGEEEVNISEVSQKDESEKVSEKPKTDMMSKFAKRTVGKIFEDAQERYFKRRDAKAVR